MNDVLNLKHIVSESKIAVKKLINEGIKPDIVIFDPPRKGCESEELELLSEKTGHIIYISCNPATLARDSAILIERGFNITDLQPVDMFPNTYHIETICEFQKS